MWLTFARKGACKRVAVREAQQKRSKEEERTSKEFAVRSLKRSCCDIGVGGVDGERKESSKSSALLSLCSVERFC